ncbi:MAG: ribonuclease III [Patescibacteria group bacterium]
MADLSKLQKTLGVRFKDADLFRSALVHRSYLNENRDFSLPHNERLEFLGDAVLELVVTDHLYRTYDQPEGELTSLRSALVRTEHLAKVAGGLGLGQALLMSKGEEKSGGRERPALLANVCEAVIGAIYLDQGYDTVNRFIHHRIISALEGIIEEESHRDPKSLLQEAAQEQFNRTPRYKVLKAVGPDHAKSFTVAVRVGDNTVGEGQGNSKQEAERVAAEAALRGPFKKPRKQSDKG